MSKTYECTVGGQGEYDRILIKQHLSAYQYNRSNSQKLQWHLIH